MAHLNVEVKARCDDPDRVRRILVEGNADFKGTDHQVDTYFNCPAGRLKLRQGNIENSLIHYDRPDAAGPKKAVVTLYHLRPDAALKDLLAKALGVRVVVRKTREIHFINNVKFHIDNVEGLGSFVEIEAIDQTGRIGAQKLQLQCRQYMELFGIRPDELISGSYGDMLLSRSESGPCSPSS